MTVARTLRNRALATTTLLMLAAPAAMAADLAPAQEPVPQATMDAIEAQSPWQVRVRGLGVITHDSGSVDQIGGSGLSSSDSLIPELDITYYLTDNFAAELILGTSYANIYGEGSIAGLDKIGKTWFLPPTLTLQYHFTDFGAFKPYVGAGINYTMFYNQSGATASSLDVKDSFAFYYVVLAVSALALFLFYRIVNSPFGEILRAIKDKEPRVESLGMKPEQFKYLAFILSASLAGLAGALKATVFQFATLTDASWPISGEVILMTLLGGLGTLSGPMFGAAIVVILNDELAGLGEWALIAQGVILLVVIVFFRRGFVGELSALIANWKKPAAATGASATA